MQKILSKTKQNYKENKVVFLLGSERTVPQVSDSSGIATIVFETVTRMNGIKPIVVSKWSSELSEKTYNTDQFQSVFPDYFYKLTAIISAALPYRVRKKLFIVTPPERIAYYLSMCRKISTIQPGTVVTYVSFPLFKLAAKTLPKARHFYYFHGSNLGDWSRGDWKCLMNTASGLLSICDHAFVEAREKFGEISIPHIKVMNGVNSNLFNLENANTIRGKARANLGISDSDVVVMYAGRLTPEKGVDKIVTAVSNLIHIGYGKLKMIIAGDPKKEKKPNFEYVQSIKGIADAMPVGSVKFVGWIPNEQLLDLYAIADVGILASDHAEGNSMFIIECQACGVPVIATNVGGLPEVVEDGKTGILIDQRNAVQGITTALKLLCDSAQLRTEMGLTAAKISKQKFSFSRVASDIETFITS